MLDKAKLARCVPAGFVPESGGARNLPKFVGLGRAMGDDTDGESVDAAEAQRIGLVSVFFRTTSLLTRSSVFAEKIAARRSLVRHAKALVRLLDHNKNAEGAQAGSTRDEITALPTARGHPRLPRKRPPNYRGRATG